MAPINSLIMLATRAVLCSAILRALRSGDDKLLLTRTGISRCPVPCGGRYPANWNKGRNQVMLGSLKKNYRVAPEVKEQIIKRVKEEGIPVAQDAKEHGIHESTVYG
jgi:hypothetical protein